MKKVENRNILLVEDNKALLAELRDYFAASNNVSTAETVATAKYLLEQMTFDVVVLDVILPDGSGLDLLTAMKIKTPVIILSNLASENNMLDGFKAGVCDYIVKPCSPLLVEARMALRLLPVDKAVISKHNITLNTVFRTVTYKNQSVTLTSSEFNILYFLMQNAGIFYTANEIYENVWQMQSLNTTTIKVHLHSLRKKLSDVSGNSGALILTEFGKGYAFVGSTMQ